MRSKRYDYDCVLYELYIREIWKLDVYKINMDSILPTIFVFIKLLCMLIIVQAPFAGKHSCIQLGKALCEFCVHAYVYAKVWIALPPVFHMRL